MATDKRRPCSEVMKDKPEQKEQKKPKHATPPRDEPVEGGRDEIDDMLTHQHDMEQGLEAQERVDTDDEMRSQTNMPH